MAKIGAGQAIYDLRKRIQDIQADLALLDKPVSQIPEMIESSNLRRFNEYLSQTNDKKTELLSVYEQYSEALEGLLDSVFSIQNDLKDILKEQSALIPNSRKKPSKSKSRKK